MNPKTWYELCTLRDDVRSGKLTLDEFAADLNDARMGVAPAVYREPGMFFDRTYPTHRMKRMVTSVLERLSGRGGAPVLRLQVAYGGGKTHTLITLLHLAEHGHALAHHATVQEFLTFAGLSEAPKARVALLPGDKMDVIEGLEVYGPTGRPRQVRTLWGALAYQLAGDAGYARLKRHDEEFTVPAEPLLVDLLSVPQEEGLGSLILVDEAIWYYRSSVNRNPRTLGTIKDFYQVLTQAVGKVNQATMVASLIASHIEANDATGTQCLLALDEIFGRIAEPVEPVTRDDVAEILRRRLFARYPTSLRERRPAIDAMMAAMNRLALPETQRNQAAYERYLESYPFHPELINVLYQKWTQMDNFQRTRGALRLLAVALREAEGHDHAPMIAPNTLLRYQSNGGRHSLSPALSELIEVLSESHKWLSALTGELEKARQIQDRLPTLKQRELEQAVIATFLHSQPLGQRATPADLYALLAHPQIDAAAVEEGLRKWRQQSWFLVEDHDVWQLGTIPNLTHMHYQATQAVPEAEINDELRRRIKSVSQLKAADSGVKVHILPRSPRDIDDDLRLHYLVLDPTCAVTPGYPIPQAAEDYFNQKAGPRIYRNNIVALVPESASVAGLREQVRRWLGWKRLEEPESNRLLTEEQKRQLPRRKKEATSTLPEAVLGAYRIALAVDEEGEIEAQTLRSSNGLTPFERLKTMLAEEERLVLTLDPDLILPDSYLELWADEQTSQRVTSLMEAFGQFPRLPRLLKAESLYETLKNGIRNALIVLRLPRPDGSAHTWWLEAPSEEMLRRPEMEVVPIEMAQLDHLSPSLLSPNAIADLWPEDGSLTLKRLRNFFEGPAGPNLRSSQILADAVRQAVQSGSLMACTGDKSYYREEIPGRGLPSSLDLAAPPAPIGGGQLTAQALPYVWREEQANLQEMADALASQFGHPIPWGLLKSAVNEALRFNLFEIKHGAWPCSPIAINDVIFGVIEEVAITDEMVIQALKHISSKTPTLKSVKETIEQYFLNGRPVPESDFLRSTQSAISRGALKTIDDWREDDLTIRIRQPDTVLFGETQLDALALERLAEHANELYTLVGGMNITFNVSLTLEGEAPDEQGLARVNELLGKIKAQWRVG